MSTGNDIVVAAFARSARNQASDLATRGVELLSALNRSLRGMYAIAARVNPEYVGAIVPVTGIAGVFARPANAESVFWLESAAGAPVAIVPPAERDAEAGLPSVYRLGRSYVTVGRALDPALTATLNFYVALRPVEQVSLAAALPATFDDAYENILILDLALYLAIKDSRMDEMDPLRTERGSWLTLYVNFLRHETANLKRRFGLAAAPSLNELNALMLAP